MISGLSDCFWIRALPLQPLHSPPQTKITSPLARCPAAAAAVRRLRCFVPFCTCMYSIRWSVSLTVSRCVTVWVWLALLLGGSGGFSGCVISFTCSLSCGLTNWLSVHLMRDCDHEWLPYRRWTDVYVKSLILVWNVIDWRFVSKRTVISASGAACGRAEENTTSTAEQNLSSSSSSPPSQSRSSSTPWSSEVDRTAAAPRKSERISSSSVSPSLAVAAMTKNAKRPERVGRWYFGGLASAGAACITHPLDLLKVHLQVM